VAILTGHQLSQREARMTGTSGNASGTTGDGGGDGFEGRGLFFKSPAPEPGFPKWLAPLQIVAGRIIPE
jgi:hypothetical protein